MTGLLSLLQNSSQSLQAQSIYTATVAQNLSNANTDGYSRQTAQIAAVLPGDRYGNSYIGRGAVLQAITQSRDRFLEAQMPGAFGSQKQSATETQILQSVSVLDSSNPNGLSPAVSNFYSQLRALAQDPGNASYRQSAVSSARQLAYSFNQTAQSLDGARRGIDSSLEARLPELNQQLARIADLNEQVTRASIAGASPNDLLDARQRAVDRVAELTGAQMIPNSEGDANLTLPDGTALVTGNLAASFSTIADVSNGGHLALRITLPDGSTPNTIIRDRVGGEVGGMLTARDGALLTAERQVDQLAYDLGSALNSVHQGGYALDGSTGRDLFTMSATVAGAARDISINTSIASDPTLFAASGSATSGPGDSTNLLLIIGTESQPLSGGTSVSGSLAALTTAYGAATERAAAVNEGDQALLNHLSTMRASASGVSIDEELVNMTKSQRAYDAIAKVIKTADEMLNTLMALR